MKLTAVGKLAILIILAGIVYGGLKMWHGGASNGDERTRTVSDGTAGSGSSAASTTAGSSTPAADTISDGARGAGGGASRQSAGQGGVEIQIITSVTAKSWLLA